MLNWLPPKGVNLHTEMRPNTLISVILNSERREYVRKWCMVVKKRKTGDVYRPV